ncbi:MAG TPA: macro domain-containing protein [Gemmatimonadales bacterium]|nr:macro domain-containing protein [Gemmatimonadales bacterium]
MIRVVEGDLARQAVDAVLRPADATLAPIGSAAGHLDDLGGPGFASQRRTATPLEAGAAVVTGGGDLAAGYVVHVVVADHRGPADRERVRRALVSAWQRAGDWGLSRLATAVTGLAGGRVSVEAAVGLLVETLPGPTAGPGSVELTIVVQAAAERDLVEAIVRRKT